MALSGRFIFTNLSLYALVVDARVFFYIRSNSRAQSFQGDSKGEVTLTKRSVSSCLV